ncbi:helix-turn-helix domain-containing protein [Exiguobacterium sp. JLM-2]|uniref:helix-turn-helix domain-containing protein n=1 Tax=Exiguobacterium sp. JLM-2 TaxID=1647415 RepID=UPI00069C4D47|nr:helix-turn-helix domain-containing protein [Exiguobacterium sp. JLM-2]
MENLTLMLNDATLQSLSNHASKEELNATFAAHRDRIKDELTKTEREIFFMLACYSVKYPGVSWLAHKTIASDLGCSTKTVQRAFNKFVALGAVEVFEAKRTRDKRRTTNIVRFIKVAETAQESQSPAKCPDEATDFVQTVNTSLTTNNLKDLKPFEDNDSQRPTVASVTKKELASAYDIPEQIVYATNALRLSDRKFVELFANNGVALRDALFKHVQDVEMTPYLVRWDLTSPTYLKCLQSAAVRTAYVAKHYGVKNVVGYFVRTYCDLVEKEMAVISAA